MSGIDANPSESANGASNHFASQHVSLLLGLALMAAALFCSGGIFHLNWLWVLPTALFIFYFEPKTSVNQKLEKFAIVLPAVGFIFATILMASSLQPTSRILYSEPDRNYLLLIAQLILGASSLSSIFCLYSALRSRGKAADIGFFATLFFLGIGLVCVITCSPRPWIDVWTVQEEAANAFIHGLNPYTYKYYNIYPAVAQTMLNPFGDIFVYMPGVIYLLAPFKYFGLDTRLALISMHLLSAILLLSIGQRSAKQSFRSELRSELVAYLPALLFAIYPLVPYLTDQAWNDTFTITFLILCFWSLQTKNKFWFFASISGMFLIKQHVFIFLPLFVWVGSRTFKMNYIKTVFLALLPGLLLCLPFLLWGWRDFLGSLYGLQFLNHPGEHIVPDRLDAFNLLNWITQALHLRPSFLFPIITALVFFETIRRMRASLDLRLMSHLCGCGLLLMFLFAPAAFVNYYWFVLAFFFIAFAISQPTENLKFKRSVSWNDVLFVGTRCFLIFSTNYFFSETANFHDAAVDFFSGSQVHFTNAFLPLAMLPALGVQLVQELIPRSDLLTYRSLFILTVVSFDVVHYLRIRKANEAHEGGITSYIVLSTALFLFTYDSLATLTGLVMAMAYLSYRRGQIKSAFAISLISTGLQSVGCFVGFGLALLDRKRPVYVIGPLIILGAGGYFIYAGGASFTATSLWTLIALGLKQIGIGAFAAFRVDVNGGVVTVSGIPELYVVLAKIAPYIAVLLFGAYIRFAAKREWSIPWLCVVLVLIFTLLDPASTGAGILAAVCLLPLCAPNSRSKVFVAGLFIACGASTLEFRWLFGIARLDGQLEPMFWYLAGFSTLAQLFTIGWAIFALPHKFVDQLSEQKDDAQVSREQNHGRSEIELNNV